ncbi:hypothetical protein [Mangrovihabitans endophyticus]|uniref:Uncharacterized protein n=1 Tax=Mangrovihabitans endophyticus TaxID=1751298 RepID=A0A8J3BWV3_9ACTN|nr:hypothetical protein [Mangrovihabitans endophyticus]GGK73845.1 hypothetical protein GCM10012284_04710 [Mangrovihabitans endophyticus]
MTAVLERPGAFPAHRRAAPVRLSTSLVTAAGDCVLAANRTQNPAGLDWAWVARRALARLKPVHAAGLVLLGRDIGDGFRVRYLTIVGDAVPTSAALMGGARLIGQEYGYRHVVLHWAEWTGEAALGPERVSVHLGDVRLDGPAVTLMSGVIGLDLDE